MFISWREQGREVVSVEAMKRLVVSISSAALICFAASAAAQDAAKSRPPASPELEALTKAAQAEGELLFYSGATENVAKRVAAAFTARYGIKAQFIRLGGTQLIQRFSSEAEAGTFAAEVFFTASISPAFGDEATKKGWIEPILQAGLPVIKSGEYPPRFIAGTNALVQMSPWLIAYNSDRVKPGDVPKDWPDLLSPRWKSQLLLSDPRFSDAYTEFWSLLYDKYGPPFFAQLRPNLRVAPSGVQATQALAAGEGSLLVPAVIAQVTESMDRGAPLKVVAMELTTGVEMKLTLTARNKVKHPNAARLFANYLLSPEGNREFNNDPGGISMYETARLPKQYQSPKPGVLARKEEIAKALGF